MSKIKAVSNVNEKMIGEFFREVVKNNINIPPNQRPYSWEVTQINDFLDDLEYTRHRKGEYIHYFNMVTFYRDKADVHIYDGQQRITTSYLTLLLYTKAYKYIVGIYEKSNKIQPELLDKYKENVKQYESYITNKEEKKKLHLYSMNDEMLKVIYNTEYKSAKDFVNNIREEMDIKHIRNTSNNRLINAVETILKFIKENHGAEYELTINPSLDVIDMLSEYLDSLLNNFQIISGEIKTTTTAYKIFELVNHRGKELSDFDLVKNYFYQIVSTTEKQKDVEELNEIIEEIFKVLGDDAEDAIKKHWLLFFNHSNMDKYGLDKKILDSIKRRVEIKKYCESTNNPKKREPYEMVEEVFGFLKDLKKNLKHIEIFYRFKEMTPKDFVVEKNKQDFVDALLDYESLKNIYVYYKLANYDYIDYYLYYLMISVQKKSIDIDLSAEFKKVVAFYLTNTVTQERMSQVESLNKRIGYKLEECKNGTNFDVNHVFAGFIYEKLKSNEGHYDKDISKETFKDKLTVGERDFKGNPLKLIFAFIYDNCNFNNDKSLFKSFYQTHNDSVEIVQEEHIFPVSGQNEDYYNQFRLNYDDSKMKLRLDWLGNKLLLPKSDNVFVGADIDKKLDHYLNQNDDLLNTYSKIFVEIMTNNERLSIDELERNIEHFCGEVQKYIKDAKIDNEEKAIKIETRWRETIGQWFKEYDLLNLDAIQDLVREKKKSLKE